MDVIDVRIPKKDARGCLSPCLPRTYSSTRRLLRQRLSCRMRRPVRMRCGTGLDWKRFSKEKS